MFGFSSVAETPLAVVPDYGVMYDAATVEDVLATMQASSLATFSIVAEPESISALDETSSTFVFLSDLEEQANASFVFTTQVVFPRAPIVEGAGISGAVFSIPDYPGVVTEGVSGADELLASVAFISLILENAVATEHLLASFLWNEINISQDPNWMRITHAGSATWQPIDITQAAVWEDIDTP